MRIRTVRAGASAQTTAGRPGAEKTACPRRGERMRMGGATRAGRCAVGSGLGTSSACASRLPTRRRTGGDTWLLAGYLGFGENPEAGGPPGGAGEPLEVGNAGLETKAR